MFKQIKTDINNFINDNKIVYIISDNVFDEIEIVKNINQIDNIVNEQEIMFLDKTIISNTELKEKYKQYYNDYYQFNNQQDKLIENIINDLENKQLIYYIRFVDNFIILVLE